MCLMDFGRGLLLICHGARWLALKLNLCVYSPLNKYIHYLGPAEVETPPSRNIFIGIKVSVRVATRETQVRIGIEKRYAILDSCAVLLSDKHRRRIQYVNNSAMTFNVLLAIRSF